MANTLRFKRGLVSGIPTAALGEPLFTTDTFDLYIGNGTGNTRFQKYIASGTTSQLLRGDGSLLTMPIVLTSPSNGQVLKFNGTSWVNDSDAGITGSGSAGQVAYFTGATTQSGSNNLFWDATNSRLGINNATPAQAFDLVGNALIKGSGSTSATTALIVENNAGTDMALFRNNRSLSFISDAGQLNIFSSADATNGILELDANSSASQTIFVQLTRGTVGLATSGNQTAVRINGGFSPTSGTGTWHNLHINPVINQTGGANGITRAIYIQPSLTSAADWRSVEMNNNSGWGIYQSGASAKNYFAGNTLIGSTSDNGQRFQVTGTSYFSDNIGIGVSNSAARLINIGKNISGSTIGFGIAQVNNVASDVTNSARIFYSEVGTQAAAFTLSELNHYYAVQGTFGAGSAVTSQYGFRVFSNLTGATSNFGFYGDIASGTGRWNLYMNGTAANYLNGSLGISSTSLTGINLRISKTITGAATAYGVFQDGQLQTDVTANGYGFINSLNTIASTNVSNYFHFRAVEGNIGASTTVANHFGFYVNDMSAGTARYGYWANLSSASNKWNFYAGGSAANYFNGNTIIGGTATDAGFRLDVNGTMRVSGASTLTGAVSTTSTITSNTYVTAGTSASPVFSDTFNLGAPANLSKIQYGNEFSSTNGSYLRFIVNSASGTNTPVNALTLFPSGAATFSSSVTAGGLLTVNGGTAISTANFTNTGTDGGIDVRNTGTLALTRSSQIRLINGTTFFGANDRTYQIVNIGTSATSADYFIQYWDGTSYFDRFRIASTGAATFSSSVQAGGGTTNASAILQADSTTKGFLPPRMTTTQRNAITTPAAGLIVYDTTDNKHYGYNGTTWNAFY